MKEKWNHLSKAEQRLRIGQILFSVVAIFAAVLQLSGIWLRGNHLAVPSVGIAILLQSFADWKKNKLTSVLGLLAGISCLVMFLIGLLLN